MRPEFVVLCLLLPALVSLCWMLGEGVSRRIRRRRERGGGCRRHVRTVLVTKHGLIELCHTCDAGLVVDGRWQFVAPVEADHTLG
jgi:hypothetical protein